MRNASFGLHLVKTTLFLVRHAEAAYIHELLLGWKRGIHLIPEGGQQAAAAANWLHDFHPVAVYSSPLERCVETAGIIATQLDPQVSVQISNELGEIRFGEWSGKSFSELDTLPEWRRYNALRSVTRPPGGESALEVQSRMVRELDRLARAHSGRTTVAVSHGDPIRLAIAYYAGIPVDLFTRIEIATASISAIAFEPDEPRILMVGVPVGKL